MAARGGPGDGRASSGAALRVRGLEKAFGKGPPVLKGIDVSVEAGELLVVLGANGSGKSTLLRCAVRLLDPDAGEIWLGDRDLARLRGRDLRRARREVAMVFQQIYLVRRRSAIDNVCCGALGRMSGLRSLSPRLFPADVRRAASASLERVGLADLAAQRADTLSGGQAQRVAIARALCQEATVILADEPVASLDPRAADEVMGLLAEIAHADGLAVIAVLHQPDLARRYADRVLGMAGGTVVFDRPTHEVPEADMARLYHERDTGDD